MLGCGSSVGSPVLGRDTSGIKQKDWRTRSSIYITLDDVNILIDTSPDFRQQALKNNIKNIDFVLYTHSHADHTHGIDDLRIFSYIKKGKIGCFANEHTINDIKKNFSYIFNKKNISGRPRLDLSIVSEPFIEQGIEIEPLPIKHKDWDILGYRINNFAYITDCSFISDETLSKVQNLDLLIIDALRYSKHDAHLSVDEAVITAQKISPKRTILTHMGSDLKFDELVEYLPKGIEPGYDGLVINI
jgi:phosphoribosyl 1,2-cyclic phosphate phosphodiesterase